ncbi:hypothetical protein EMEDMD4_150088 [Sinorhizobium medicae]|uniref:Uncharacterized protein n=1 Tax=Sinorhizobium medicae TaxID=110321 RepID=A0A508WU44_9HYPH|nr:hypothetical protein EMEDMD4_150088 [Sinorhizobium medicae]
MRGTIDGRRTESIRVFKGIQALKAVGLAPDDVADPGFVKRIFSG